MAGQALPPFGSLGDVRRAGEVLRRAAAKRGEVPSIEEVREARAVVEAYRSAHAEPLHAAYMGLRSCLTSEGFDRDVSAAAEEAAHNRGQAPTNPDDGPVEHAGHRRLPGRSRHPGTGRTGCRALLCQQPQTKPTARQDQRLCGRPRDSGYRAIHVHTRYHGRRIEVQLRTRDHDNWAKIVEDLTRLSEGLSRREPGQPLTEALKDVLTRLAMMTALGSMLTSRDRRTGEE